MSNETKLSRFFGGGFELEEWILPIAIIFLLFSFGDEILEFFFCEDNALIWIILLVVLFMFIDSDDGCGCGCC